MSEGQGAPASSAEAPIAAAEAQTPTNTQEASLQSNAEASPEEQEALSSEQQAALKAPAATPTDAKKAASKVDAKQISADKFKIKVDGEELELNRDELVKYAQLGKAGQARMAEAAQIRKEAQQLITALRDDPESVLADPAILGSNEKVMEFARKLLSRQLEDEQKSPEVLRAEKAEKELEKFRKERKDEQEKKEKEDYDRMVAQNEAQLEEQITSAIESSGLPKSPFILKRMADVMISAMENDKEITPKAAMNIVRREMEKDLKEFFDVAPEDVLEQLINSEKVKSLRNRHLAKIRTQQAVPADTAQKPKAVAEAKIEEKPKKISMKDFLRGK